MNKYDIAVIVLTYNPVKNKLYDTIDSILNQRNLKVQLIVSDDGSEENFEKELEDYLGNKEIDYYINKNQKNLGTVKNLIVAMKYVQAPYVKTISPGDSLINDTILYEWLQFLKIKKKRWSFSDCTYFIYEKGEKALVEAIAKPQNIKKYIRNNDVHNRNQYILAEDIAIGAAILSETVILSTYLKKIEDIIFYCEDVIYRMMMCDGEVGIFFPKSTLYYEYGSGISTSSSKKWGKIIKEEWISADQIILKDKRRLEYAIKFSLMVNCCDNDIMRIAGRILFQRKLLKRILKEKIKPRLSNDTIKLKKESEIDCIR